MGPMFLSPANISTELQTHISTGLHDISIWMSNQQLKLFMAAKKFLNPHLCSYKPPSPSDILTSMNSTTSQLQSQEFPSISFSHPSQPVPKDFLPIAKDVVWFLPPKYISNQPSSHLPKHYYWSSSHQHLLACNSHLCHTGQKWKQMAHSKRD